MVRRQTWVAHHRARLVRVAPPWIRQHDRQLRNARFQPRREEVDSGNNNNRHGGRCRHHCCGRHSPWCRREEAKAVARVEQARAVEERDNDVHFTHGKAAGRAGSRDEHKTNLLDNCGLRGGGERRRHCMHLARRDPPPIVGSVPARQKKGTLASQRYQPPQFRPDVSRREKSRLKSRMFSPNMYRLYIYDSIRHPVCGEFGKSNTFFRTDRS